ncbi:cysteine hydrolase family protein [Virgibacillus necropolis]|uniref:Isochorismatase n=1 Tax=Virgibacillus necropolis TaxID=163877 RepID=A0A221MBT1_9BACI|nr:isochorismatase family cysteine hydrolase [Virgibacillus necropolis]ASN05069.1 isochorismatase [Virgibacillus necropolis]
MLKKVLLNIDYTYDFVADDGALTCGKPGQDIEDSIVNITERFIENGDYVVFAVDKHTEGDKYHPEMELYPPHNIAGTKGRELYGKLKDVWERNKDNENVYWMDKTRYSAFVGTDLDLKLRERQIEEVHVVGCCSDICVLHTAVDAYNRGYRIVVHEDGVASFNQTGHEWALKHVETCLNAKVV